MFFPHGGTLQRPCFSTSIDKWVKQIYIFGQPYKFLVGFSNKLIVEMFTRGSHLWRESTLKSPSIQTETPFDV